MGSPGALLPFFSPLLLSSLSLLSCLPCSSSDSVRQPKLSSYSRSRDWSDGAACAASSSLYSGREGRRRHGRPHSRPGRGDSDYVPSWCCGGPCCACDSARSTGRTGTFPARHLIVDSEHIAKEAKERDTRRARLMERTGTTKAAIRARPSGPRRARRAWLPRPAWPRRRPGSKRT